MIGAEIVLRISIAAQVETESSKNISQKMNPKIRESRQERQSSKLFGT